MKYPSDSVILLDHNICIINHQFRVLFYFDVILIRFIIQKHAILSSTVEGPLWLSNRSSVDFLWSDLNWKRLLPIERGLSEGCQYHSTYNWYKGRNYPKRWSLCAHRRKRRKIKNQLNDLVILVIQERYKFDHQLSQSNDIGPVWHCFGPYKSNSQFLHLRLLKVEVMLFSQKHNNIRNRGLL